MTQAPTPSETARGYSPPSVRQYRVFLDNKVGKLHELVEAFDQAANCQICAMSVHEASDHAVVRIIPNCSRTAKDILRARRLAFSELDILVVEFGPDHSLPGLCLCLLAAELNISFCYPVLLRTTGKPTIAICVDDNVLAGQILRKKGFRLLGEADLPKPGEGRS